VSCITWCREKKLLALIQKQDRLLYLCFYMLLNLSEDVGVEKKMKKKVRLIIKVPGPQLIPIASFASSHHQNLREERSQDLS
jgi:hypothetical protein